MIENASVLRFSAQHREGLSVPPGVLRSLGAVANFIQDSWKMHDLEIIAIAPGDTDITAPYHGETRQWCRLRADAAVTQVQVSRGRGGEPLNIATVPRAIYVPIFGDPGSNFSPSINTGPLDRILHDVIVSIDLFDPLDRPARP
jgi:hypothetical protein